MTKRYARIAEWKRAVADHNRNQRDKRRKRQPPAYRPGMNIRQPAGRPVSAAGRPAPSPSTRPSIPPGDTREHHETCTKNAGNVRAKRTQDSKQKGFLFAWPS